MKKSIMVLIIYLASISSINAQELYQLYEPRPLEEKVEVVLSVPQTVVYEDSKGNLDITITIVNCEKENIDYETILSGSKLFINDIEFWEWKFIMGNGPRPISPLIKPHTFFSFGFSLSSHLLKTGNYNLYIQGINYKSNEITFKILPKKAKSLD